MMSIERMNRIEETLALDPHDRYALAELRALENPCISPDRVKVGDRIRSNSLVKANQGVFQVASVTPIFGGAYMVITKGVSKGGVPLKVILTFGKNEDVEVVR